MHRHTLNTTEVERVAKQAEGYAKAYSHAARIARTYIEIGLTLEQLIVRLDLIATNEAEFAAGLRNNPRRTLEQHNCGPNDFGTDNFWR